MLPASLAIAWPLWRRHRWGLLIVVSYLVGTAVAASLLSATSLGPQTVMAYLGPLSLPLIFVAMYLMAVFSYGFDADVSGRESCFPAELFCLPLGSGTLALW